MSAASTKRHSLRLLSASAILLGAAGSSAVAAVPANAHPSWSVVSLRPSGFEPMVTGLGFLSDGRLVICHWGGLHNDVDKLQTKGAIYIMKGVTGDSPSPSVTTYASGLADPVGMLVKDDKIYVTGGEQLIELPDANNDGKADAPKVICKIPGTHARHEFLFGLAFKDGKFYMSPSSGKDVGGGLPAWGQKNPNRGTTLAVDPATGTFEVFSMGLREPNGMGLGPENELFVPDVQGNWLPANKLINIRKGRFYGFKHEPAETWDNMKESPPVVYLPQGDLAQAPGNPLYISAGNIPGDRFVGQMLIGDAVNGGIRRVFLEKVNNEWQGSVFWFSGGLEAGANRLLWGPDGYLYVGMCGQGDGWSYKMDWGLQKMKPSAKETFEVVAVRSRKGGMEIEYTHEVNAAGQAAGAYNVRSWNYNPTSAYGGSPIGTKTLAVGAVQVSADKKKVFLPISGLEAGKLVNIRITGAAAATGGLANWTTETWYTLNNISDQEPFTTSARLAGPAPVRDDGLNLRASAGMLELAAGLAGIDGAQVRDLRGTVVADLSGRGARTLEIPTRGWAPGVYSVAVRSGARLLRRTVAIQ